MSTITGFTARATMVTSVEIELTEAEARALNDLSAFASKEIVAKLGEVSPAWARDFGPGFASLLDRARQNLSPELDRLKAARAALRREP